MKQNIIHLSLFALAFALAPAVGSAQNLNPVVEISKSYVGKLSETRKPVETMAVPDSLMRFDLDFDYSVFDNPYRGAYIFSPYVVDIKPAKVIPWNRQFFFKAGAGYQLRPELDLFWSPKTGEKFKMNVYAKGNGFYGNYKNIGSVRELVPGENRPEMAARHTGYDFEERAGMNGWWDWKTGRLLFDVAYSGLHNSDSLITSSYNALDFQLRLQSNKQQRPYFYYDARFQFRAGNDHIGSEAAEKGLLPTLPVAPEAMGKVPAVWVDGYNTHFTDIVFDGTLGPKLGKESSFMMDFYMGLHRIGLSDPSMIGSFNATPRYVWEKNRWKISAGVKLAMVYTTKVTVAGADANEYGSYLADTPVVGKGESQHFYPYFYAGYDAVKDYLNLYFKIGGGDQIHDYTSLKQRNHFFNLTSASNVDPVIDNTINKFDFTLGFRGNIAKRFDYNVYGGFRSLRNGLVDEVVEQDGNGFLIPVPMVATVGYQNYNQAYVNADFTLNYRSILVDGRFGYNYTNLFKKEKTGFEPARFQAALALRYNWKNRLHIGIDAEGMSNRRGYISDVNEKKADGAEIVIHKYEAKIPYWVDLGLSAEFFLTRKMSVWMRGDNLMNCTIQPVPLYSQPGIGFTAGICINL